MHRSARVGDQERAAIKLATQWLITQDGNGDGIIEDTRGNPVTFSLKTNSSNTTRIAMMNFIKADLAKVGINVNTSPVDFNTLITNLRDDFQYDAMLLGLQSGVPPAMVLGWYVSNCSEALLGAMLAEHLTAGGLIVAATHQDLPAAPHEVLELGGRA